MSLVVSVVNLTGEHLYTIKKFFMV